MPSTPPRFIYFDMGNVLLHFERGRAVDQITRLSGAPRDQVQAFISDEPLRMRWECGQLSAREYHEHFCQRTQTAPPLADWKQAASDIFQPNAEIIPLLVHLRTSQHRLGVLSNTCDSHWEHVCTRYRIMREMFSVRVVSFQEGAAKPSPEFFSVAADRAQVAPEQIFFTDDFPDNVRTARGLGWQAVLYESPRGVADALHELGSRFNY